MPHMPGAYGHAVKQTWKPIEHIKINIRFIVHCGFVPPLQLRMHIKHGKLGLFLHTLSI